MTFYPVRQTHSLTRPKADGSLRSASEFPKIDLIGHFQKSLSRLERVPLHKLRTFTRTVPARKAIRRISNGVLAMPWVIQPPQDLAKDEAALERAATLAKALRRPNIDTPQNTYSKLVRAIVTDLLTTNVAAIERMPGNDEHPFWLWTLDVGKLSLNPAWTPQNEGITPRYFYGGNPITGQGGVSLMNKDAFLIQSETSSWEQVPASPMEVAYRLIEAWLGIGDFQRSTTTKAIRNFMITMQGDEVSDDDVHAFRQYWELEVEGKGKIPIVGGSGEFNKIDFGAKNDEELYLKYTDYILSIIALAFDLASRDYNIREPDNRSTAVIAADSTFANAVLPMAVTIEEHVDLEIIDFYEPDFGFEYTDTEPRGEKEEADIAANLFEKGVITRNMALKRVGEEPIPNGDLFSDGTSLEEAPQLDNKSSDNKKQEDSNLVIANQHQRASRKRRLIAANQLELALF